MKTAVSIPDDVFQGAERLARRSGKTRSQVYSDALRDYIANHSPDEVTESMNRTLSAVGEERADFAVAASVKVLRDTEW